ncbi:hypothetical protein [Arthrobacter sp. OAP107]|uniref:hypothetical protein n=1 Tax=Arthrobacter sp. OAP107 TaxID=3156445 RepID=UPI003396BD5D
MDAHPHASRLNLQTDRDFPGHGVSQDVAEYFIGCPVERDSGSPVNFGVGMFDLQRNTKSSRPEFGSEPIDHTGEAEGVEVERMLGQRNVGGNEQFHGMGINHGGPH